MSQPQPKLSEYKDYQSVPERHAQLPITSLPLNGITEEADPTLEIRTLIEQLQQTARDARTQTRAAEMEKDAVLEQLARAEREIDLLRENERELRSHFVEVTSLIQARDAAVEESERHIRALADAAKKFDGALRDGNEARRQRDDAIRKCDETERKFDAFRRASDEQSRLIGESQKQLLAIRQARDGAHAQILDLTKKLTGAEDEIADTEYRRELAEKAAKQAEETAADYRRRLDATTSDRDATAAQIEALSRELDEHRRKVLDLTEQKSAVLQADGEHAAALAEARSQVLSLTQERDAARSRAQEQSRELEESRVQFQKMREEAAEQSALALAEAHERLAALETEARESRHSAKNIAQQLEVASQQLAAAQTLGEASASAAAEARRELDVLIAERDAAQAALDTAQKQTDGIAQERDNVRESAAENARRLDAEIVTLRDQLAALTTAADEARARQQELATLQKRFERQRVETIDITAQLQTAHREIRELSASLAEARLQVKFTTAASRAAKSGATKSDFARLVRPQPAAPEAAPSAASPGAPIEETLTDREARSALGAMRHCFQSYMRKPADLSLLNELHCHAQGFSERARTTGHLALYRLCAAFSEMTHGLYEIPEQVNQSTIRTVGQTIEFLGSLVNDQVFALARDPATARIYVVDDDADNCDAIRMALETASMLTHSAQDSAVALAELSSVPCDLILLDVNLPGMDGFELCRQIRALPLHEHTPIVFVTGLATLENRVQSTLSGGSDFIAKPFNLHELSVKAMTLILKSQLQVG